jgi:peptidoglycan/LPS O-acetylase OafA/YrhL
LIQIKPQRDEENNFRIFNGIRVLSISWVIYGHSYLILALGMKNVASFPILVKQTGWITLTPAAYFAVDVFFFIGGFLTGVLLVRKLLSMKKLRP